MRPNKARLAHRISWAIHHGEIPQGFGVLHKCDTPACVRPDHLFLGTQRDNNLDRDKKGRAASKLKPEQVLAIREDDRLYRLIAADYGITLGQVCNIKKNIRWKNLEATNG